MGSGSETESYNGDGSSGVYIWGKDFEVNNPFPSSYIATAGSTVARAAESLNFPYLAQPRATTVYVRSVEKGTILRTGSKRVFEIGTNGSNPRLTCIADGGVYKLLHVTDDGTVTAALAVAPSIGDTNELVCQLSATGTALLVQSVNGAASTQSSETAALTLGQSWSSPIIYLGGTSAGDRGFNAFVDILIVAGVHSLADCRKATQQ